jgi:hypothetical protein
MKQKTNNKPRKATVPKPVYMKLIQVENGLFFENQFHSVKKGEFSGWQLILKDGSIVDINQSEYEKILELNQLRIINLT